MKAMRKRYGADFRAKLALPVSGVALCSCTQSSLKCECIYLHDLEAGAELKAGLGRWITTSARTQTSPGEPPSKSISGSSYPIIGACPQLIG